MRSGRFLRPCPSLSKLAVMAIHSAGSHGSLSFLLHGFNVRTRALRWGKLGKEARDKLRRSCQNRDHGSGIQNNKDYILCSRQPFRLTPAAIHNVLKLQNESAGTSTKMSSAEGILISLGNSSRTAFQKFINWTFSVPMNNGSSARFRVGPMPICLASWRDSSMPRFSKQAVITG